MSQNIAVCCPVSHFVTFSMSQKCLKKVTTCLEAQRHKTPNTNLASPSAMGQTRPLDAEPKTASAAPMRRRNDVICGDRETLSRDIGRHRVSHGPRPINADLDMSPPPILETSTSEILFHLHFSAPDAKCNPVRKAVLRSQKRLGESCKRRIFSSRHPLHSWHSSRSVEAPVGETTMWGI